ncbi:TPA: IS200/IS605 family transposase [Salmonella enterica]
MACLLWFSENCLPVQRPYPLTAWQALPRQHPARPLMLPGERDQILHILSRTICTIALADGHIFIREAIEKLRSYFTSVLADFDAELVEMDGECDHIHLLINYPPNLAVSSLVNSIKGVSSRLLRRARPDIAQRYYNKGAVWTPGYFASSC